MLFKSDAKLNVSRFQEQVQGE